MLDSECYWDWETNDLFHKYWSLLWLSNPSLPKPVICLLDCYTYLPVQYHLSLLFHSASGRSPWPIVGSPFCGASLHYCRTWNTLPMSCYMSLCFSASDLLMAFSWVYHSQNGISWEFSANASSTLAMPWGMLIGTFWVLEFLKAPLTILMWN